MGELCLLGVVWANVVEAQLPLELAVALGLLESGEVEQGVGVVKDPDCLHKG